MSRLEEIKNEYAKSEQCDSIEELFGYLIFEKGGLHRVINIIAERYAEECMINALKLGSFSANMRYHDGRTKEDSEIKYFQNGADNLIVNRESITKPENIILL